MNKQKRSTIVLIGRALSGADVASRFTLDINKLVPPPPTMGVMEAHLKRLARRYATIGVHVSTKDG